MGSWLAFKNIVLLVISLCTCRLLWKAVILVFLIPQAVILEGLRESFEKMKNILEKLDGVKAPVLTGSAPLGLNDTAAVVSEIAKIITNAKGSKCSRAHKVENQRAVWPRSTRVNMFRNNYTLVAPGRDFVF